MFTGIIETIGKVTSVQRRMERLFLQIEAKDFLKDIQDGGSVSVDGVCLTVTAIKNDTFGVDAIKETLSKTTMQTYTVGRLVNLEKPLRFSDRLDGHLVQGHIDGTAVIAKRIESRGNVVYGFRILRDLIPGIIKKGSIAIDGISLTVVDICSGIVSVAIIPYTLEHTTLGAKKTGDSVNIETDVIGKYIARRFNGSHIEKSSAAPFM